MILIIDNYDSFTYNLYQMVGVMVDKIEVIRNDKITLSEIKNLNPQGIILSPGPSHPKNSGICLEVIKELAPTIPTLGVCLGHQAIAMVYGANIINAKQIVHGKEDLIMHTGSKLFNGVNATFAAARYHSLLVDKAGFPPSLTIDATDGEGRVMALSHKDYPIYGVQFHPESILTIEGATILNNFVSICDAR